MHNITSIIGILALVSSIADYFALETELREVVAGSEAAVGVVILVYSSLLQLRQKKKKSGEIKEVEKPFRFKRKTENNGKRNQGVPFVL